MTALVTADLHLSEKIRDSYRFKAMEKIAALIEKHKVDEFLLVGDITENKDYHPATLVNDIVEVISSFSLLTTVIINTGNHDYTQTDTPFFHFLRRLDNVHWDNKVQYRDLSIGRSLFLPHTRDYKRDWAGVIQDWSQSDWIFAHNTFAGAVTEHGKKLSGIPTDIFPEGVKVVSGDIHTPQRIGPVTYVGAPYTVDFGDAFEPRVLLLSEKSYKSIPVAGPQKRLVELQEGYAIKDIEVNPGDIVKVRYELTPEEQPDWLNIKNKLRHDLGEKLGCIVHLVQPDMSLLKSKSVLVRKVDTKSDEQVIREFGKQRKLAEPVLKTGLGFV